MDRTARALALVSELTAATTVSKVVDVFQEAIEPFGVRLYRTLVMGNLARMGGEPVIVSNWPDEWDAFYKGKRAFTFDPVAAEGLRNDGFFWRDLPPASTAEGRQLMSDAREIGMTDGFTAVFRAPGVSPTAASLAGESLDWSELDRGVMVLLSNSLISRMLYLRDIQISPTVEALTVREKDILRYATLGYSDKRIALVLGLTHETIRFYWKNVRRKLGAVDRANAVAIGLWSGQMLA
jgi:LuxR family quorum sensing-dependent transcriptional regulator